MLTCGGFSSTLYMFLIVAFFLAIANFGYGSAALILCHMFFESTRNAPYRQGNRRSL